MALDVKDRESNRHTEWESVQRVKCMIEKFKAGANDVSECQSKEVTEELGN